MQTGVVKVVAVDPFDEVAFRATHEAYEAGSNAGRTDPPARSLPEALVAHQHPSDAYRWEAFAALDDGVVVGGGELQIPLRENLGLLMFDLAVPPQHRGRGVGSALHAYVEERARAEGRSSLLTELNVPDGTDPEGWPGTGFLRLRQYTLRNTEILRRLTMPLDPGHLDALEAKAAERASGYRLVSWTGACPEEYAEQYAHLKGLLAVEAPMGDLDYEQEVWDVARLREDEAKSVDQGRTLYTCIALAPDGEVAGHTQIMVPSHQPGRAYQWDTLVVGRHRGHRLGLALKVANVREVQAGKPDVTRMDTWNAEQNGPMVAVNVELGFEILERSQEWQRQLT